MAILFRPFGLLARKTLNIIWLSNISILSVPDEGYPRSAFCALNLISTFYWNHFREYSHLDIYVLLSLLKLKRWIVIVNMMNTNKTVPGENHQPDESYWPRLQMREDVHRNYVYIVCYLDVNRLMPKISACRAILWSLFASERSEHVTNFIFSRARWYFSEWIKSTFRWHACHHSIKHRHGYILHL